MFGKRCKRFRLLNTSLWLALLLRRLLLDGVGSDGGVSSWDATNVDEYRAAGVGDALVGLDSNDDSVDVIEVKLLKTAFCLALCLAADDDALDDRVAVVPWGFAHDEISLGTDDDDCRRNPPLQSALRVLLIDELGFWPPNTTFRKNRSLENLSLALCPPTSLTTSCPPKSTKSSWLLLSPIDVDVFVTPVYVWYTSIMFGTQQVFSYLNCCNCWCCLYYGHLIVYLVYNSDRKHLDNAPYREMWCVMWCCECFLYIYFNKAA